jgi:two-component system chemotaxis response regulator CheY
MAKILIVDDSETIRMAVKSLLVDAGHEVIAGADGKEGLELALNCSDLELIISDFNMPGLDGVAMCKAIGEERKDRKFPILMLTTEGSQTLKDMGKAVGVIAWVTKPYNDEKLLIMVQKILEREKNKVA